MAKKDKGGEAETGGIRIHKMWPIKATVCMMENTHTSSTRWVGKKDNQTPSLTSVHRSGGVVWVAAEVFVLSPQAEESTQQYNPQRPNHWNASSYRR